MLAGPKVFWYWTWSLSKRNSNPISIVLLWWTYFQIVAILFVNPNPNPSLTLNLMLTLTFLFLWEIHKGESGLHTTNINMTLPVVGREPVGDLGGRAREGCLIPPWPGLTPEP